MVDELITPQVAQTRRPRGWAHRPLRRRDLSLDRVARPAPSRTVRRHRLHWRAATLHPWGHSAIDRHVGPKEHWDRRPSAPFRVDYFETRTVPLSASIQMCPVSGSPSWVVSL